MEEGDKEEGYDEGEEQTHQHGGIFGTKRLWAVGGDGGEAGYEKVKCGSDKECRKCIDDSCDVHPPAFAEEVFDAGYCGDAGVCFHDAVEVAGEERYDAECYGVYQKIDEQVKPAVRPACLFDVGQRGGEYCPVIHFFHQVFVAIFFAVGRIKGFAGFFRLVSSGVHL